MNDSIIKKAVLAMNKLQGQDDWRIWAVTMRIALGRTWVYVGGDKMSPPPETDPNYNGWKEEDLTGGSGSPSTKMRCKLSCLMPKAMPPSYLER